VHEQHRKRKDGKSVPPPPADKRALPWKPHSKVNHREP